MEQPRRHPEVPEGGIPKDPEKEKLEEEFYKAEIADVEKKIHDKKEEFLRLEATTKWLGQMMVIQGLDDDSGAKEAMDKLEAYAKKHEAGGLYAALSILGEYAQSAPFMNAGEIKTELLKRQKAIKKELSELAEDAVRMEGANEDA